MNSKKVKALRKIYDSKPMLRATMSFKKYKTHYIKDVTRGSEVINIIKNREVVGNGVH